MPHNLVIVKPGEADEVGTKAIELGAAGFEKGFVPDSPDILVSTKLVDHGKEQSLEFASPSEPGAYPFACTFPGHHLLMRGTMHVKSSSRGGNAGGWKACCVAFENNSPPICGRNERICPRLCETAEISIG